MVRPVPFFISAMNSILVILILLVPVDTQGPDASCATQIKLRKNIVYTVSRESMLNISCHVTFCKEIPLVRWTKIDDTNKYIHINETNQMKITQEQTGLKDIVSYLSFSNIAADDSGVYRCMISTPNFSLESHNINVNVSDSSYHSSANKTSGFTESMSDVRWLLYVFISLGTLGLVMTVMLISFLCINRCSGKANTCRNKNAMVCQEPLSATTSRKSQDILKESNNIYDAVSNDLDSELESVSTENEQKCTSVMRSRNRSEGGSQIVYATLQHPTPRDPSAVRNQSREKLSEYASIRIG